MASTPGYALSQLWPSLTGSTADKISQVNAMTVEGSNVDISISQVAGYLLLKGVYPTLTSFASSTPTNSQPHDGALTAAKTFVAWIGLAGAPAVHMSDPGVFADFNALAAAIVAQETASPGSTGCTQGVLTGLLALAQTTQPWWQANGFSAPVTLVDASNNGLT
jgi:hypothetical protein